MILWVGLLFLCSQKVEAAELKPLPQEEIKSTGEIFTDLENDDTVVQLPNEAFLKGKAVCSNGTTDIVFNSETDPNAVTVEEANDMIQEEQEDNSSNLTPSFATRGIMAEYRTYTIYSNSRVQQGFDMRYTGWHSMNDVYVPSAGTGAYLLYKTQGDSAMVGTGQQALSTMFYGRTAGTPLVGENYFTGGKTMYTYFARPITTASGYTCLQILSVANW